MQSAPLSNMQCYTYLFNQKDACFKFMIQLSNQFLYKLSIENNYVRGFPTTASYLSFSNCFRTYFRGAFSLFIYSSKVGITS